MTSSYSRTIFTKIPRYNYVDPDFAYTKFEKIVNIHMVQKLKTVERYTGTAVFPLFYICIRCSVPA